MRNGKYYRPARRKSIIMLLALILLVVWTIGGTLAWLTDKTDEVTNTFTTSNINVELEETTDTYKMVPGWTIKKDPKAKVVTGSEKCYLFVKVEETIGKVTVGEGATQKTLTFGDFLEYEIADGWIPLTEDKDGNTISDKIYYRVVDDTIYKIGEDYSVLKDDQVTVKKTVTKEMMKAVTTGNEPKLTFTAYASQLYKTNTETFTAAEAWANVNSGT